MCTTSRLRLVLLASAAIAGLIGCPGGNGSGDGGTGSGLRAGRPWDPSTCAAFSVSDALGGSCTDEDAIEWGECVVDSCESTFAACYGPSFLAGEYSSTCRPFIDCAARCDCYDADCVLACPIPQDCLDCFEENACRHECSLSCSLLGPREGKTCDDTLKCCPGLPNESLRQDCINGVRNVQDDPDRDATCATFYSLYSVISSTCD